MAVDLEICYAPFDKAKLVIAFLATQICELNTENAQFDVEYKENKFFLRTYGIIDNIPDNWEEE